MLRFATRCDHICRVRGVWWSVGQYTEIIPSLLKVSHLRISGAQPATKAFGAMKEDGRAFLDALLFKIQENTLEVFEVNYWYRSWSSVDNQLMLDIVVAHCKKLQKIKFHQDECVASNFYKIEDTEVWRPVIAFHDLLINRSSSDSIQHWLDNTLKSFEFSMKLIVSREELIALRKMQDELVGLERMIRICARYCEEHGISFSVKVDCAPCAFDQDRDAWCRSLEDFRSLFDNTCRIHIEDGHILNFTPQIDDCQQRITKYLICSRG